MGEKGRQVRRHVSSFPFRTFPYGLILGAEKTYSFAICSYASLDPAMQTRGWGGARRSSPFKIIGADVVQQLDYRITMRGIL
jgi:hypothetical protein